MPKYPLIIIGFIAVLLTACSGDKEDKNPADRGFQDYVITDGKLTNEQFYRLVTCGKKPSGTCRWPTRKWRADKAADLTVAIWQMDASYPPIDKVYARRALKSAVKEINLIGSALRLRIVDPAEEEPDIRIYIKDLKPFTRITDVDFMGMNGSLLQGAVFKMAPIVGSIKRAVIVMSNVSVSYKTGKIIGLRTRNRFLHSAMLEELIQTLGFPWDIRNQAYRGRSIFDQDSSNVTTLWGQDSWVLHRHYPLR